MNNNFPGRTTHGRGHRAALQERSLYNPGSPSGDRPQTLSFPTALISSFLQGIERVCICVHVCLCVSVRQYVYVCACISVYVRLCVCLAVWVVIDCLVANGCV